MNNLKRLALAVTLGFVLAASALAGETNTPPCPTPEPGETNTPPCSGTMSSDDPATTTLSTSQAEPSQTEMLTIEAALSALETMMAIF